MRGAGPIGRRLLAARVQWDALRHSPLDYLQGIGWRLRGLKVRSRNRNAALKGHSARAYDLWMALHEEPVEAILPPDAPGVLIDDGGSDEAAIAITRASLPKGTIARPWSERAAATPGWFVVVRAGDRLAPHALAAYADAIAAAGPDARLVYADDDLVDRKGRRRDPHFKPGWNPDLFAHHDMISHASALRLDAADLAAELTVEEAVRRLADAAPPVRLPEMLHHRRTRPAPALPLGPGPALPAPAPHVTILVPTRDRIELLSVAIEGVRRVDYPSLDVIVIDNDSTEAESLAYLDALAADPRFTVVRHEGPFNYAEMHNRAVLAARGDYLCFLNNDVEMLGDDWLARLVAQAVRPELGAVGARLLYEDGTIQHAGVITGVGGAAGHAHRFLDRDAPGYFHRTQLPQRVRAVTAACLVVAKEKFLAVGGFDPVNFPVAFNDVDLCLKLEQAGWASLYEPRATLIHHESKSRGSDRHKANRERFVGELENLKRIWRTDREPDPFHHPALSPFTEQYLLAI